MAVAPLRRVPYQCAALRGKHLRAYILAVDELRVEQHGGLGHVGQWAPPMNLSDSNVSAITGGSIGIFGSVVVFAMTVLREHHRAAIALVQRYCQRAGLPG